MDTLGNPTPETGGRRSLGHELQGLQRGLALIERTRSRDDRRVILGCVFKDLDDLRDQASAAPPHLYERFSAIQAEALEWRAKIGAPVAPDEDPGKKSARPKRRKEEHHGPLDKGTHHPDPEDGAPAAQVVSQE